MERAEREMMAQQGRVGLKVPSWALKGTLLAVAGVLMIVDLYLIFMWAPTDANLGHVQRVFYFHVPMAWMAYIAFLLVFISSIVYLWRRSPRWDILAHSASEIGVVFTTLVLITGVIWAKPVWGVWWTWEPRLTTTLILWLIYVAYLMLRAYAANPSQGSRYSAVLGIVGFIVVPINYFAVSWWRAVHPGPVVGPAAEEGSLDPSMRTVFYFSVLTFAFLFAFLLWERVSLKVAETTLRSLRWLATETQRMK